MSQSDTAFGMLCTSRSKVTRSMAELQNVGGTKYNATVATAAIAATSRIARTATRRSTPAATARRPNRYSSTGITNSRAKARTAAGGNVEPSAIGTTE